MTTQSDRREAKMTVEVDPTELSDTQLGSEIRWLTREIAALGTRLKVLWSEESRRKGKADAGSVIAALIESRGKGKTTEGAPMMKRRI
jgi:hypothetical protein